MARCLGDSFRELRIQTVGTISVVTVCKRSSTICSTISCRIHNIKPTQSWTGVRQYVRANKSSCWPCSARTRADGRMAPQGATWAPPCSKGPHTTRVGGESGRNRAGRLREIRRESGASSEDGAGYLDDGTQLRLRRDDSSCGRAVHVWSEQRRCARTELATARVATCATARLDGTHLRLRHNEQVLRRE